MKKFLLLLLLLLLVFCRSSANHQEIIESDIIQVIINGKKIELNSPILLANDTVLFPLRSLLQELPLINTEILWAGKERNVTLLSNNAKLVLQIDSNTAFLNSTPFSLLTSPILYKNKTYIPLRIVSEFLDCRIAWDNPSKSVFIKSFPDYLEAETIFNHSNTALQKINSIKMDIINEFIYPEGNFSLGYSTYVDKASKKIYTKNMLDSNWKVSEHAILPTSYQYEEQLLPFCFSLDKKKSNENTYVLTGFYPSKNGTLLESSIFIDTLTFQLVKLTTKNTGQSQNVLYQYEVKL